MITGAYPCDSKYELANNFGTIASGTSNVVWTDDGALRDETRHAAGVGSAYVAANEDVLCWDLRTGESTTRFHDPASVALATSICQSTTEPDVVAVG